MTLTAPPNVNISFESHLADTLSPLRDILPGELAEELNVYLTDPRPATIPYAVLLAVSKWARSAPGMQTLTANGPLNPADYTMIGLLAGTTTSPERKFGSYVPPPDPEVAAADAARERKQITTLINAVLSIGGAAFAAFWASQHTGWKYEWRVLFSFFVAIVVAVSEAVLYIIWQSRRDAEAKPKRRVVARHKKHDTDNVVNSTEPPLPSPPVEEGIALRRRKQ